MSRGAPNPARGLTSAEAARRLAEHGPNRMPPPRRASPVLLLLREMVHFFALLLWAAAGLALLAGMPQLAVAIVVIVLINGGFAFAQEYRADRAAQRLRELVPAGVTVRRDGRRTVVDAAELVPGDVVLLEAGDRVPADLELAEVHGLAVDESMLTGESVAVRPGPGDRAFAGTFVVEGAAEGVVVATGTRTRLAAIASLTEQATRPRNPLEVQLGRVVRTVAIIAVGAGAALFAVSLVLGMPAEMAFLFGLGVTVALVPEGLLPTVTLSLARAAQRMAGRNALVRHLEAVETLGSATFICTDKTGTLTRNEMTVAEVWTAGHPATGVLRSAVFSSTGRMVRHDGGWKAVGAPMEAAPHADALRRGRDLGPEVPPRFPFDPHPLCAPVPGAEEALAAMSERGLRVLAVGRGRGEEERDLTLLGLVGLEDPPREDVAAAIEKCRAAGIKLAMVTGDHPGTAQAIAAKVGLLGPESIVITGAELPASDRELGELLDRDGVAVARVTPEVKLRLARALRGRGHVVAMTGDGVNDGPALREADIGVAMGASGTDVAREAADLVLLDDHFATIVAAV